VVLRVNQRHVRVHRSLVIAVASLVVFPPRDGANRVSVSAAFASLRFWLEAESVVLDIAARGVRCEAGRRGGGRNDYVGVGCVASNGNSVVSLGLPISNK
jgi:hypothetical protein